MSVATGAGAPQSASVAPPYPAALSISGPSWHSPLAHGRQVPLLHPEIHIGLLEANDVVLADLLASRMHAVIRWTPAGYMIQDLNSTNGTFVQGQRITEPTPLTPGQHIRIGGTDLLFQALQVQDTAPDGVSSAPPSYGQASAPGVATIPTQILNQVAAQAVASRPRRWLARQRDKRYWRVFLTGLAAYILSSIALSVTDNPHMVPLVLLLASALVPVTFVIFCWEAGAFGHMPATVVGLTFISGAVLGLVVAALLEPVLVTGAGFGAALMVGFCEESAKALAVLWFLRDKRLRSELDGLVLGAAAGMGFAALETAGYGFASFLGGFADALGPNASLATLMNAGIGAMTGVLVLRMALAVFGHGVWTAIVGAAIWRERGQPTEHRVPSILLAFVIAIVLHALWDTGLLTMPVSALVGIFLLRFFIRESVERAKLGPDAPPPAPLAQALGHYCTHAFHRFQRPLAHPTAFATAPQPYPSTMGGYPPSAPTQAAPSVPSYAAPTQPAPTASYVRQAPPQPAPASSPATPPLEPLPSAAMPSESPALAPSTVPAPSTPPAPPSPVSTEPPAPPSGHAALTPPVSKMESTAVPDAQATGMNAGGRAVEGMAATSATASEGLTTPAESTAPVEPPTAATETHRHRPAHHRRHHAVEDTHIEAPAVEQTQEQAVTTPPSMTSPDMVPATQPEMAALVTEKAVSDTTVSQPGTATPQPVMETASAPTFCGHCGVRVAPGATFCGHCGASLRP